MRKHLYLITLLLTIGCATPFAQTTLTGSFLHDGINRTYSFYVPASYTPGQAVPLVIGLHGLSSNGADFAQYRDFKPIADTANFIVANPDGSTLLGIRFWNYGSVGSNVDDVGFLEALIDTLSAHYGINAQRVYCVGMSNGSFMSYYMACQSSRFAAIGGVTGSMSTGMYAGCQPVRPTPAIHIHGTDDNINPYGGTSSMVGIDQLNRFWVNQNGCDTVPTVFTIPDTDAGDGATATRYLYSGGTDGNTVELFKVTGGGHSWPGGPMPGSSETTCMDFNASAEIWRFFSRYTLSGHMSVNDAEPGFGFSVSPNPATSVLDIRSSHPLNDKTYTITDVSGKTMASGKTGTAPFTVDITGFTAGVYFLTIDGYTTKIIKQ